MEYDSELIDDLKNIDPDLYVSTTMNSDGSKATDGIYLKTEFKPDFEIYDLKNDMWINNGLHPDIIQGITDALKKQRERHGDSNNFKSGTLHKVFGANEYESFATIPETNSFKNYTDHLAEILQEKNDAYGDSFTKSVDEDGLLVLKIRLGDKFNRVSSLIKKGELKENDESLEDTLLDMAGYSILGLKWLKEHENES